MGTILWAISSGLLVLMVVYFLPIGFSVKGKLIVVLTGFLLALAGLAATASFSLWLAILMITVLVFFAAYILDSRLSTHLYVQTAFFEEQDGTDDSLERLFVETAYSHKQSEAEMTPVPLQPSNEKETKNTQLEKKADVKTDLPDIQTDDEDISFLLNRRLTMKEEIQKQADAPKQKVDYLAEIEDLLSDGSDEGPSSGNQLPESEFEIPVITVQNNSSKNEEPSTAEKAKAVDGLEEIPVLPYHEKEDEK